MADIKTEREMSRTDVATYLHRFADKLDGNADDAARTTEDDAARTTGDDAARTTGDDVESSSGSETTAATDEVDETTRRDQAESAGSTERVTFTLGNDSATVNPPETIQFEVAVDSTAGMLESGSHETVAFTLQWDAEPTDDEGELDIH
jgi:hypothetical protein